MDRHVKFLSATLVLVTLAVYSNCYQGQFVLDDRGPSILKNPTIRNLGNLLTILHPPSDATVTSRPLLNLTLAVNYHLEGTRSTVGYHAINVAIHVANSLLLFGLVRQTLLGPRLAERFGLTATQLAFACALLWVVHPLCTSCVTYIVQRAESLMTMCLLATLYCSMRANRGSERSDSWTTAALVTCGLGMTSKEVMFVAPFIVPLYDWVFDRESFGQLWQRRKGLYMGLAATWLVLFWAMSTGTRRSIDFNFSGKHPMIDVTSWDYAKTQAPILLHYLRLAFWPRPLVFDYDWPIVQSNAEWLPHAVVLVGLSLASLWALSRRRPIGFLGCFFFLMLGPSSSFLVVYKEVAAEHRMYLPLAMVVVTLVIGGWQCSDSFLRRMDIPSRLATIAGWVPVVLVAILLSWLTYQRNPVFHDRFTLWQETVAHAPGGARPQNNLGMLYGIRADESQRRAQQLEQEGQIEESLARSKEAAKYTRKMIEFLRKAIEIKPEYPNAHYNLGRELHALGKLDDAETSYRNAIEFYRGRDPRPHDRLGLLFVERGKLDAAIEQFHQATEMAPHFYDAQLHYGNVLIQQGKYELAKKKLQRSVQFNKRFWDGWQRLAELCALAPDEKVRDGASAAKVAQRLVRDTPRKSLRDIETLAAALAEQRSFAEAADRAASLVEQYRQNGNGARAEIMRKRQRSYQTGRPLYWVDGEQGN